MTKNEKILQTYEKQIACYPHLDFQDAVALYKKNCTTDNENVRKRYMDELITGTLYIVLEYIKKTDIVMFCNQNYDAWDIINAFNESWIRRIYNGYLSKYQSFSHIINRKEFFNEVYRCLGGNIFNNPIDLNDDTLVDLLTKYLTLKNTAGKVRFHDLISTEIKEKCTLDEEEVDLYYEYYGEALYYEFAKQYSWHLMEKLFLNIYKNTKELNKEDLQEQKLYIKKILPFIINMGVEEPLDMNLLSDCDVELEATKKQAAAVFLKILDELARIYGKRGQRFKQVIIMRYGLDGKGTRTQEEVGKILGVGGSRIYQIEDTAIRCLRSSQLVRKLNVWVSHFE
mgnify:CR=1 FL=1